MKIINEITYVIFLISDAFLMCLIFYELYKLKKERSLYKKKLLETHNYLDNFFKFGMPREDIQEVNQYIINILEDKPFSISKKLFLEEKLKKNIVSFGNYEK